MKTMLTIIAFASISLSSQSQNVDWYYSTDGTSAVWGGWDYKDIVIPDGMRVDSVYGGFRRPGFADDLHDYIFSFNVGPVYDNNTGTSPWVYANENTSLYNRWIDLTSFSYIGEGVVRVGLPTPAGAVWDSLGIATTSTLGIEIYEQNTSHLYPNPATDEVFLESNINGAIEIYDLIGHLIYSAMKSKEQITLDISDYQAGIYFIRESNGNTIKFIKK